MPITLTVSEGVLSTETEAPTFAALTQALLSVAQLEGNAFMTPNVIGTLNVIPAGRVFAAGKPAAAAFVELTLPQIALATPEAKQAFTEKATAILERAAGGRLTRDHIWTNIVYAADGSWGIAGHAHSNADLVEAIQEAAIG
ncbi:Tautomerase enzyme [Burkholderia sp. Ax-1719]|uniref:tautomerase family protein n=1 Tax=Burkholderia sp. Ax-1719 TaxID=2608334 RepID=UPI00141F00A2|nr:Tautomerase enzyme [Burkholderia sp. Ax-1719]NIE63015.1 Tautomerase enzyme [Burkholderia sp. Ax-1719]